MGMLSVNTRVRVTEFGGRTYDGIVKGYDQGKTKYQVAPETSGGSGEFATTFVRWVFSREIEELVWSILDNAWVTRSYWDTVSGK